MKNIALLTYAFSLSFLLLGCNDTEVSATAKKHTGYFVTVFNEAIDYSCENKRQTMNDYGKFECASFPISFYIKGTKIGEINSIHKDGYVYPQDIIVLENLAPMYTSDNKMGYLEIEELK